MYNPAYGEMYHQTPGYSCGYFLNKKLDSLQENPETITSEEMVNIKNFIETLFACIYDLENTNPDQAGSLTNMYCGIMAKMRNLYDTEINAFVRAVNEINKEEDKVAFKKILLNIGINCD